MADQTSGYGIARIGSQTGLSLGNGGGLSIPVPFATSICLVEDTYIAGTARIEGLPEKAARLEKGEKLRFRRNKASIVDPWTIEVFKGEDKLGLVPCDCNEILARLMDGGKNVYGTFLCAETHGSWVKLRMEVSMDD